MKSEQMTTKEICRKEFNKTYINFTSFCFSTRKLSLALFRFCFFLFLENIYLLTNTHFNDGHHKTTTSIRQVGSQRRRTVHGWPCWNSQLLRYRPFRCTTRCWTSTTYTGTRSKRKTVREFFFVLPLVVVAKSISLCGSWITNTYFSATVH